MTDSYDMLLAGIKSLIAPLNEHKQQAAQACAPIVEHIISSPSRDAPHIERTLARLLDCGCHPVGLALVNSLCRYYFALNPAVTAAYARYYRKMWGSDMEVEQ
jgi:hypothetical protein